MKKIVFLFISMLAVMTPLFAPKASFSYDGVIKVTVVTTQSSAIEGVKEIKNGTDYYITMPLKTFKDNKFDIKGLVLTYPREYGISTIKKNLFVKNFYQSKSGVSYGYTPLYKDFRFIEGKKVNVQIFSDSEEIKVGLPLILTGF